MFNKLAVWSLENKERVIRRREMYVKDLVLWPRSAEFGHV